MQRISILVVMIMTGSIVSIAQWTPSGSDIYWNGTGNLGIGTTFPAAKLSFSDVDGSTLPNGITWFNPRPLEYGIYKESGAWAPPNYQQLKLAWETGIVLYPGTLYGKSYVDVQGNGLRVTGGNVGVGTTDPAGKLHVIGVGYFGNENSTASYRVSIGGSGSNYGSIGCGYKYGLANFQHTYAVNDYASQIRFDLGGFNFLTAPVGTAGNPVTFTSAMNIAQNGNVGIGTSSPAAFTLDISTSGDYKGVQLSHNSGRWTRLYSSLPPWSFNGITAANDAGIIFGNLGGTVDNGFVIAPHQNSTSGLRIDKNGNVGVGTSNPTQKLTVNGTIYSKEVKVDLSVPGPDYVFEETYNLPSLTDTENYIKQNKHLPEVPSACEMEENGINLSEMNMILLKKVEELTLYLIEQNRVVTEQGNQIKVLEKKLNNK